MQFNKSLIELVKYGLVGVLNTLICLGLIFVCKSLLGINEYLSNAIGYVAGFINSFLCNRAWVFQSHGRITRQATLFMLGFAICYGIQFITVWAITQSPFGDRLFPLNILSLCSFTISGYGIATLIGNVVYTLCNFIYNKLITFKP